ncbi:hypothetical protein FGIG_12482 [Fasciola gigantica]|uniref:Uncharacterized protein n=1 Tax=Fasciola gigantica TaxID=46835 RepID=A0A504YXI4_FASGI|nr:hypothetical protein FGIG_12482 [Fasciola gigantica]
MAAELCNQYESTIKTPTLSAPSEFVISPDQSVTRSTVSSLTDQSLGCASGPSRALGALFSQSSMIGIQSCSDDSTRRLVSAEVQTPIEKGSVFSTQNELSMAKKPSILTTC